MYVFGPLGPIIFTDPDLDPNPDLELDPSINKQKKSKKSQEKP
jgi:hypothetical protein